MVCTGGAQQVQRWAQQPGSEEGSRLRASEALQTQLICSRAGTQYNTAPAET